MPSLYNVLDYLLSLVKFVIFAHVIMSWLLNFQVLNARQPLVQQVWMGLSRLLEPLYGPVRRLLPAMGGLDLAPLVVLIAVHVLQIVLRTNQGAFA